MAGVVEDLGSRGLDALAGDHGGQEEFQGLLVQEALMGVYGALCGLGEGVSHGSTCA